MKDINPPSIPARILITTFGSFFLLIDQVSKYLALDAFKDSPVELLNGFFHFQIHNNPGVAFGLPIPTTLIIVFNIALLIALIIYFQKELDLEKRLSQVIIGMIIGGAIANIFDRFIYEGTVIDFIGIGVWPYFNFADAFIVSGILSLFLFHGKINRITHSNGNRKSN